MVENAMSTDNSKTKDLIVRAIEKAWIDASYKELLLRDAEAAINELDRGTYRFLEGRKIVFVDDEHNVHESTEAVTYIGVNQSIDLDNIELSEDQLEAIAGGHKLLPLLIPSNIPILELMDNIK